MASSKATTSADNLARANAFLAQLQARRSIYPLNREPILADKDLVQLIQQVVRASPSAFHSQTSRVVILLGKEHEQHWSQTAPDVWRHILPDEEKFKGMAQRFNMFANAYGTVLFYEDQDTVKEWQEKQPSIAGQFPEWAIISSGMAQINVWTALEQAGYGANLQHLAATVQEPLSKQHGIPSSWKLHAELVFGNPTGPAKEKTYIDDAKRFKVIGSSS